MPRRDSVWLQNANNNTLIFENFKILKAILRITYLSNRYFWEKQNLKLFTKVTYTILLRIAVYSNVIDVNSKQLIQKLPRNILKVKIKVRASFILSINFEVDKT